VLKPVTFVDPNATGAPSAALIARTIIRRATSATVKRFSGT